MRSCLSVDIGGMNIDIDQSVLYKIFVSARVRVAVGDLVIHWSQDIRISVCIEIFWSNAHNHLSYPWVIALSVSVKVVTLLVLKHEGPHLLSGPLNPHFHYSIARQIMSN